MGIEGFGGIWGNDWVVLALLFSEYVDGKLESFLKDFAHFSFVDCDLAREEFIVVVMGNLLACFWIVFY